MDPRFTRSVGERLVIGTTAYQIVALLGVGIEGAVYLVECPEGLRVAKIFHDAKRFDKGQRSWLKHRSLLPVVLARDERARIFLLEYHEGIPVFELNQIRADFSRSEFIRIHRSYEVFAVRTSLELGGSPPRFNVLYRPGSDSFQLIDPN